MLKNLPQIDKRNAESLLREIKKKSLTYTPEWVFDPDNLDGGGAIATLFTQMFSETIERLNRMPYKYYLEFLNLLGVDLKYTTPAMGIAAFSISEDADSHILIPKNTRLFCDLQDPPPEAEDGRVVFETQSDFHAVSSELEAVINVNPARDIIEKSQQKSQSENRIEFFNPNPNANIQRHRFALACEEAFFLKSPSDITLSLENTAMKYRNAEYLKQLTNGGFASWSYFDGRQSRPFDSVFEKDGKIHLLKKNSVPIAEAALSAGDEENTRRYIYCDMTKAQQNDEITINRLLAGCSSLQSDGAGISPDEIYANDVTLEAAGGYCFGRQLMPYNCLYILSDEVFSKRGARVNISFDLKTVVREIGSAPTGPIYDFNGKYIVEKMPRQVAIPDNIFISRLIFEYWNGLGWTNLKVEGDINPFDGRDQQGTRGVYFICPEDIRGSIQNSIEGCWLRARIIEVENPFSLYGRMLLPLLESVTLNFSYQDSLRPVELVYTENNCEALFHQPDSKQPVPLFRCLNDSTRAVYLAFTRPLSGYPFNLYFKTEGSTNRARQLRFEYYKKNAGQRGNWNELKVNDLTGGLSEDGIVSVFSPDDYQKASFFSQQGYFLRIALPFNETKERVFPAVSNICLNAVDIIQKQTVRNETFKTEVFEPGKSVKLANRPALDGECWVNEISDISKTEQTALQEAFPNRVEAVKNDDGQLKEFWVKWEKHGDFSASGPEDRHFVLDGYNGVIRFGDGVKGKIPSVSGSQNIRINYSFGGGRYGNLPPYAIGGLVNDIPFVDKATNPEMTSGGSDRQNIETLERIGPQKLRHRNRAVTLSDFENIVLSQFPEVRDVRCFNHLNREGRQEYGFVTVVVMPHDIENKRYSLRLCRRIEQYLSGAADCEMLASGHFAVVPAVLVKVDVTASIIVNEYEFAAQAEKNTLEALTKFLTPDDPAYKFRIGVIPRASDIFNCLKEAEYVDGVSDILLEGRYYDANSLKSVPLDSDFSLSYAVAVSGNHTVRI